MKKYICALGILFFFSWAPAEAKEVNEEICTSYLNMYCTRCHKSQRICEGLEKNDSEQWRKVITEMADYDDLDQDIQDTTHACLTGMKAGDPIVCKKK